MNSKNPNKEIRYGRLGLAVIATTAIAAASLGVVSAASADPNVDAQIDQGNAFVRSAVAEVGSRPNGSLTSDVTAPDGYHATNGVLGLVVDRDEDGWGVGTDDGDFIAPGSPHEIFGVQVGSDGGSLVNDEDGSGIDGSWTDATVTDGTPEATWNSATDTSGVAVSQQLSVTDQTVAIKVTLTNTTDAAIDDVYYVRGVDPDDENSGSFETTNTIKSQQTDNKGVAAVNAVDSNGAFLQLSTTADNAVVASDDPDGSWQAYDHLEQYVTGATSINDSGVVTDPNATVDVDGMIYVAVKTPTLAAAASRTFTVYYTMTQAAADALPTAEPTPTPTDTATPTPTATPTATPTPVAPVVALPATKLTVKSSDSIEAAGKKIRVTAKGLAAQEQYVIRIGGTPVATGRADATGKVSRAVVVPKSFATDKRKVAVEGSTHVRRGWVTIQVAKAPETLAIEAKKSTEAGSKFTVVVSKLAPKEPVIVRFHGKRVSPSDAKAAADGTYTIKISAGSSVSSKSISAQGITKTRYGIVKIAVKHLK